MSPFVKAGTLAGTCGFMGGFCLFMAAPFGAENPGVALTLRVAGVILVALGLLSLFIAIRIRALRRDPGGG